MFTVGALSRGLPRGHKPLGHLNDLIDWLAVSVLFNASFCDCRLKVYVPMNFKGRIKITNFQIRTELVNLSDTEFSFNTYILNKSTGNFILLRENCVVSSKFLIIV